MDKQQLSRHWVHSHEEDTGAELVFRPADYPFPPSRGRSGFDLRPDGTLEEGGPGPTDRSVTATGTWELVGDTLKLHGRTEQSWNVVSVAKDRLVVARD